MKENLNPPAAVIALRELIAKWRERVAVCRRLSLQHRTVDGRPVLGQVWDEEAAIMQRCADELDALMDEAPHD